MAALTQYATGKRKSAIAGAWVTAAAGDIVVNEKPLEKAFPRMTLRNVIQFPLSWPVSPENIPYAPLCMAADQQARPEPCAMRSPRHW